MNVLLIGSGGREHALAWAISASPLLGHFYCAPGNPGIGEIAELVALDIKNHQAIIDFCRMAQIKLVVVGPEAPLVAGLADDLKAAGIKVFGPSKAAAQLEGSKGFTKDLCARFGIPTAAYGRFTEREEALAYLQAASRPDRHQGRRTCGRQRRHRRDERRRSAARRSRRSSTGRFGAAECVIEDYLEGEEASFFALCDGVNAVPLGTAQDHKRVGEKDTGPNTGGMGAYSPAPVMTAELCRIAFDEIIAPTVKALAGMGTPYVGVLYAGLMLTESGPKLIEYNVRFGDPETQVLLMRLKDDILTLMLAACDGTLDNISVRWHEDTALTVVMAARGYPGDAVKGSEIRGLDAARAQEGVEIFHAGTSLRGDQLIATGGRVLNVTARGSTVAQAQRRAYAAVDAIDWPEGFCRRDIGWRAIARHG